MSGLIFLATSLDQPFITILSQNTLRIKNNEIDQLKSQMQYFKDELKQMGVSIKQAKSSHAMDKEEWNKLVFEYRNDK